MELGRDTVAAVEGRAAVAGDVGNTDRRVVGRLAGNAQIAEQIGHWGPRPAVLQSWVMANRLTTPKSELYPQVRKWYARDHGETTIREVLEVAGFPVARVA